jgi:hypothetical protein
MIATSHGRRSWKDSPKAKRIAVTIALLLIAMLAVAFDIPNPVLQCHPILIRLFPTTSEQFAKL